MADKRAYQPRRWRRAKRGACTRRDGRRETLNLIQHLAAPGAAGARRCPGRCVPTQEARTEAGASRCLGRAGCVHGGGSLHGWPGRVLSWARLWRSCAAWAVWSCGGRWVSGRGGRRRGVGDQRGRSPPARRLPARLSARPRRAGASGVTAASERGRQIAISKDRPQAPVPGAPQDGVTAASRRGGGTQFRALAGRGRFRGDLPSGRSSLNRKPCSISASGTKGRRAGGKRTEWRHECRGALGLLHSKRPALGRATKECRQRSRRWRQGRGCEEFGRGR